MLQEGPGDDRSSFEVDIHAQRRSGSAPAVPRHRQESRSAGRGHAQAGRKAAEASGLRDSPTPQDRLTRLLFQASGSTITRQWSLARRLRNPASEEARMNKDELKGKVEKAKGYVKERVGKATDDPDLEAEGTGQRVAGAVQENVGKARRKVGEAVKKVGDAIKD